MHKQDFSLHISHSVQKLDTNPPIIQLSSEKNINTSRMELLDPSSRRLLLQTPKAIAPSLDGQSSYANNGKLKILLPKNDSPQVTNKLQIVKRDQSPLRADKQQISPTVPETPEEQILQSSMKSSYDSAVSLKFYIDSVKESPISSPDVVKKFKWLKGGLNINQSNGSNSSSRRASFNEDDMRVDTIKELPEEHASPTPLQQQKIDRTNYPINVKRILVNYIEQENNSKLIEELLKERSFNNYFSLDWRNSRKGQYFKSQDRVIFNHFDCNNQLLDRILIYGHIHNYCKVNIYIQHQEKNINIEEIMPKQYTLQLNTKDADQQIYDLCEKLMIFNDTRSFSDISPQLLKEFKLDIVLKKNKNGELFMLKSSNLQNTIGVHLVDSLQLLFQCITNYYYGLSSQIKSVNVDSFGQLTVKDVTSLIYSKQFIIQQYIKNPLLISGMKFTIKYLILVTLNLDIFISQKALIYMCKSAYTSDITRNRDKIFSSDKLNVHPEEILKDEINQFEELQQTSKIIIYLVMYQSQVVMSSCKDKLRSSKKPNQFEIFQFEFLINDQYQPFLIDIEGNLQYETPNEFMKQYYSDLLCGALQLTIDQKYPNNLPNKKFLWIQII